MKKFKLSDFIPWRDDYLPKAKTDTERLEILRDAYRHMNDKDPATALLVLRESIATATRHLK